MIVVHMPWLMNNYDGRWMYTVDSDVAALKSLLKLLHCCLV